MKPFEFVLIIVSVVFGLALTEFANLVATMIKNYDISTFSFPYWAVILTGFAGGLNYWGTVYLLRNVSEWNNIKMGLLFVTGLTFYACAKVLVPDFQTFNHNYIEYYHKTCGIAFAMMICWILSLMVEAFVFRKGRPSRWYVTMGTFILLLFSGIMITSKIYRDVLAFIFLGLQILNLVVNRVVIADRK